MNNRAPEQNRLDEQEITRAATAAVEDLELETEVKSVKADGDKWCVQFMTDYGQFCDTFRDQFGKENSFELIREKIKRHILKQQQSKIRAGVRVRRGKQETRPASDNLLDTAWKTLEGAVGQTANAAGEIISQAFRLPEQALTAIAGAAESVSPTAAASRQPLARVSLKVGGKSTKKSSRPARKASSKKGGAARKASGKKQATKSASKSTKKSASKAVKKRSASRKSAR